MVEGTSERKGQNVGDSLYEDTWARGLRKERLKAEEGNIQELLEKQKNGRGEEYDLEGRLFELSH